MKAKNQTSQFLLILSDVPTTLKNQCIRPSKHFEESVHSELLDILNFRIRVTLALTSPQASELLSPSSLLSFRALQALESLRASRLFFLCCKLPSIRASGQPDCLDEHPGFTSPTNIPSTSTLLSSDLPSSTLLPLGRSALPSSKSTLQQITPSTGHHTLSQIVTRLIMPGGCMIFTQKSQTLLKNLSIGPSLSETLFL